MILYTRVYAVRKQIDCCHLYSSPIYFWQKCKNTTNIKGKYQFFTHKIGTLPKPAKYICSRRLLQYTKTYLYIFIYIIIIYFQSIETIHEKKQTLKNDKFGVYHRYIFTPGVVSRLIGLPTYMLLKVYKILFFYLI
jgi:hypothetical protein